MGTCLREVTEDFPFLIFKFFICHCLMILLYCESK
jgi:hypothetical protein